MKPLNESELQELNSESLAAHNYDALYHKSPILSRHSSDFCEYVSSYVHNGFRILDLGCASASLWNHLLPLLPSNASLSGVDLSPDMLAIAKEKYPEHDFRHGHFRSIPFGDSSFDVVIVSSAFHHIADSSLDESLCEITRVLDEHGFLIGREPLASGRFLDRGGYTAGVFMHLRHLFYRLTCTQELPEPDPGPDHHAYDASEFLKLINSRLTTTDIRFRNPISPVFGRIDNLTIFRLACFLDNLISHREGSEIWYRADKNYSSMSGLKDCLEKSFGENNLSDSEVQLLLGFIYTITPSIVDHLTISENDTTL